ncbi:non-ribosomal peptide synthetase [Mucilaginibacter sp. X4EP1]|uniref:non-ribosomal peptide synthetase n=1 Tax=Mucilaginibacter sp. X4EP1 TaxID=2723092 RepID=UPI002168D503|nr:non-ribosomal peptide synthetase [Mucilaginibacter sp. X4EP1]MCS3811917.1 amino acid adenylation domain-containing protein/non-ribosomal peptide synthase protein (TIGR01720 family) [Mucilaginibacter sp. X4EP1]
MQYENSEKVLPVSEYQKRFFLEWALAPAESTYNVSLVYKITGKINKDALRRACDFFVKNNELVSAKYSADGKYCFYRNLTIADFYSEITGIGIDAIESKIRELLNIPFDLTKDVLLRFHLIESNNNNRKEYYFIILSHHIIADALSAIQIATQVQNTYNLLNNGVEVTTDPNYSFTRAVEMEEQNIGRNFKEDARKFWLDFIDDTPLFIALPYNKNTRTDHLHNGAADKTGSFCYFELNQAETEQLNAYAKQKRTTLFIVLSALYGLVLSRYSNQRRFLLSYPVNMRPRGCNTAIGCFVNNIPLKIDLDEADDLDKLVEVLSEQRKAVRAYQGYSLTDIVRDQRKHHQSELKTFFNVGFTQANLNAISLKLDELDVLPVDISNSDKIVYEMGLLYDEYSSDKVKFKFEYRNALFDTEFIQQFTSSFKNTLAGLIAGKSISAKSSFILSEPDRIKIELEWNSAAQEPVTASLVDLSMATINSYPQGIAVVDKNGSYTYSTIGKGSYGIAGYLCEQQLSASGKLIAVLSEKGHQQVVSTLGIMRSGSAYLPLHVEWPPLRLDEVLIEGGVETVLTSRKAYDSIISESGIRDKYQWLIIEELASYQPTIKTADLPSPGIHDIAYVIFTSGSTGKPKGVTISHGSAANTIVAINNRFNIDRNDKILALSELSFDLSVYDIFGLLAAGGTIVFPEQEKSKEPSHWQELITTHGITIWDTVPQLMQLLSDQAIDKGTNLGTLRVAMMSGDWIPVNLPVQLKAQQPTLTVMSLGGATEGSIWSIWYEIKEHKAEWNTIPYGQAMPNQKMYVLNEYGDHCPPGVKGEIHIGGAGVALGYWNDEAKTAGKFINHTELGRLYKTGDQGKWNKAGYIEFEGRNDDQVKIRGYRIELGEIEHALTQLKGIRQACVIVKERKTATGTSKYLAGYYLADNCQTPPPSTLKEQLAANLPEYMVPAALMELEHFPLTGNGKLNKQALPEVEFDIQAETYVAPVNETEAAVCEIWKEVLGIEQVGTTDDFFRIGGDSILAIHVSHRMSKLPGCYIKVADVFVHKTIAALLSNVAGQPPINIEKVNSGQSALSFAQERLWFIEQYEQGTNAYHLPAVFELDREVDIEGIKYAVNQVASRHEVLRSKMEQVGITGNTIQTVYNAPLLVDEIAVGDEDQFDKLISEEINRPFNLVDEYPVRVKIYKVRDREDHPEKKILLINFHHVACDGWSLNIFQKELLAYYEAYLNHNATVILPALEIQYKDYAAWQRQFLTGDVLKKQINFWREKLAGHQVLELPTDHPRAANIDYRGTFQEFILPAETTQQLKTLARQYGITLHSMLLSSISILLSKYTGQEDIIIGTPTANRQHSQTKDLIGIFVNTQANRMLLNNAQSYRELACQVHQSQILAQLYQDFPFEKLIDELGIERNPSRHPVFQVMFALQSLNSFGNISEKQQSYFKAFPVDNIYEVEKFDLSVFIDDSQPYLTGRFNYAKALFNPDTISAMMDHYVNLLHKITALPDAPHSSLSILSEPDRIKIEEEWNSASQEMVTASLVDLSMATINGYSQGIAVVDKNGSYTYSTIGKGSYGIAGYLYEHQLSATGKLIGVLSEKGHQQVISTLGIMRSGSAYLPLHVEWPPLRLDEVLTEGGVETVLTSRKAYDSIISESGIRDKYQWLIIEELANYKPIIKEADLPSPGIHDIAYVIFTSGSTGKPKGVTISHAGAANTIIAITNRFKIGKTDKILALSELSFDLSVYDIFGLLAAGGTIVFPEQEKSKEPSHWQELITTHGITIWDTVPQLMQLLSDQAIDKGTNLGTLRVAMMSGDWIPVNLPVQLKAQQPTLTVMSLGGATEGSIWSIWYEIKEHKAEWNSIPYGQAMPNQKMYVLNEYGDHCPPGVKGEIHIAGAGVALGYWNDEAKTAGKFINHTELGRLYKTGDQGKWNKAGYIEFEGRNDDQVKIRGYRIELGEIEHALTQLKGIRQACVIVKERKTATGTSKYLAGYYLADNCQTTPPPSTLKEQLAANLPEYMVPATLMELERFPLTGNGKLNKQALPEVEFDIQAETYVAPVNETEAAVCEIWKEVLGIEQAGTTDDFFRIGGDSIQSIKIAGRIRQAGFNCRVRDIFEYKTVGNLVAHFDKNSARQVIAAEQGILTGSFDLLPVQQWFAGKAQHSELKNPDHWNQSFLIKVPALDTDRLRSVIPQLVNYHDVLRVRFEKENEPQKSTRAKYNDWKQVYQPKIKEPELRILDISKYTDAETQEILTAWQHDFDLEQGPLFAIGYLFGYPDGSARIFMALHHMITDAVSGRILTEDIEALYAGRPLPVKGSSYRQWIKQLENYKHQHPEEASWWDKQLATMYALPTMLPEDNWTEETFALDRQMTNSLLKDIPKVYHTQINDLLLTALAYALKDINHNKVQFITMEGHGREDIDVSLDISRTAGWFTTMFPVKLELKDSLRESIRHIKESLRSIPRNGIGFGVFAADDQTSYTLQNLPRISFNYLGQFDTLNEDWQIVTEKSGESVDAENADNNLININGAISNGRLQFNVATKLSANTSNLLCESFQSNLSAIINHCKTTFQNEGSYFTPGDFYAVKMSQPLIDKLTIAARKDKNELVHIYPATSLQQGFIYHVLSQGDDDAYRLQLIWDFKEEVDIEKYIQAWQHCIAQYPILRTAFNWEEDIVQVIYQHGELEYYMHDISHLPTTYDKDQAIIRLENEDRMRPFDLTKPALLRLLIIKQATGFFTIIKTEHHIITEGWSEPILLTTAHQYYQDLVANKKASVKEDIAYIQAQEYIYKHKKRAEQFWEKALADADGANDINALLSYPVDLSSYRQVEQAAAISLQIKDDDYSGLKAFCLKQGITMNVIVQFIWHKLLQIYSSRKETIVGTTISGRDLPIENIEESVGLYINTLPLLIQWEDDCSILSQLQQIQQKITELNTHSFASLAKLQRDGERIFHSLIAFENYPLAEGGRGNSKINIRNIVEKIDYPLCVIAYEDDDALVIKLQYDAQCLTADRAGLHLDTFQRLVKQLLVNPRAPHRSLSILSEPDRVKIEEEWNSARQERVTASLVDMSLEMINSYPQGIAVVDKNGSYTYSTVGNSSYGIAGYLYEHQLSATGKLIAVLSEKGHQQVVSTLGIMRSGSAYLPLHVEWPPLRLDEVLTEGDVESVLTSRKAYDSIIRESGIRDKYQWLIIEELANYQPTIKAADLPSPGIHDIAYVIFTSGSTGKPKGVTISHASAANTIVAINNRFKIGKTDKVLALSELSFDLSVYDIFGLLAVGGTIVFPEQEKSKEPSHWQELIINHDITIWDTVPQLMQLLSDQAADRGADLGTLRVAMMSGDWIPVNLPVQLKAQQPTLTVMSLGGATEGSIWSIWYEIKENKAEWNSIPYGQAMPNQKMYVLNEYGDHCPIGVKGEIHIGGAGVALGYWNDEAKTAGKFINHTELGRLYKTGDQGKWNKAGYIEFEGRNDDQVKIRGYRIELGEIEHALTQLKGIRQACVIVKERKTATGTSKYLAGYYLADITGSAENEPGILDNWENLYDSAYETTINEAQIQADFSGWNSYITEKPIPLPEMEQWRSDIVQKINRLKPNCVLEIGVGSGLLMYPLLPGIKKYIGIDMSAAVINRHKNNLKNTDYDTAFYHLRADQLDELQEDERYDTIILNSVCQYFPGINYFEDLLKKAFSRLSDNGSLFIGDVRNYDLHSELIKEKLDQNGTAYTQQDIDSILLKENELLLSPGYFGALAEKNGHLQVDVIKRNGIYHNELSRYRYDVVIAKKSNASNIDGKKVTDIYPVKVSASHCNVPYLNQLKKEDILAELSATLPAYMVPNVLVALKSVPLTSNGKLDTRALPDIDPDIASEQYVEPVTTAEQEMCKIWQGVLGLPLVGITDDFFKIGGSSILAIQVTSLTNKTLGYNIKVADLFSRKSIARLLEHLQVSEAESTSLIKPYHDVYHKALSDLIFIHPGNAGSEMYQHLADLLTSGYNCIGVDNFNIQHKRKIDLLSELATHYLTEYETKYSFKDPVNLFGWSLGGQIALEMASILEERGYRNINVILLDTMLTDDNLRKLRSSENNKEIIKQMRGLLKVEMAEEYVEKVIAGVDAEVTLTNTPISNILKYTNVVLFKATQQETRLNTPATKLIFDYTKLIAGNNIDLVANHLSVINMDCNHFNILDVYSTYLSHYLLKKAYNTSTNVGVSNAVFDGQ